MSSDQRLTLILGLVSIFFTPSLVFIIRATVKWTRVEGKLEGIAEDLERIVRDKDVTHSEIITTMREDRAATDKRLRWLEEHLWKKGNTGNAL